MLSQRQQDRVVRWLTGELPVGYFNLLVVGARTDVPTAFDMFACLYTEAPHFRIFGTGGTSVNYDRMRMAVMSCRLPADGEGRYREYMQRTYPAMSPDRSWAAGVSITRRADLPIGIYALGETALTGRSRAMLWMPDMVSPTAMLDRFKKAAEGRR